jgi:long-chain acyl-CoA synthetase
VRAETIPELLASRARDTPDQPAFFTLEQSGAWRPVTWSALAAQTERLGRALHRSGVRRGTRVAILARTSLEWEQAQMAALRLGATVIGVDPNYPAEMLARALESTAPEVLVAEDSAALARIPASVGTGLRLTLTFRAGGENGSKAAESLGTLAERFAADGGPLPAGPGPDDPAIVTFSSGTTGAPKPIVYTHRQVLLAVGAILEAFPDIAAGSRLACWLPLANLFQRVINLCAMARGAASYVIADPREVMKHLPAIRPAVFIAVPRFFEKVQAGIEERLAAAPARAQDLAQWALTCGKRAAEARLAGTSPRFADRMLRPLADRLVLRRLRSVFGTEIRYLISGSAPMPLWLLEWFEAIGLPVLEAYGVSENIVPVAMNRPGARRIGAVGKPMPGNEVKLGADGEVLVRGAGVFRGYLGADGPRPDAAGYWATGDLGELTPDGYLALTGRKSDAFKTSGGRWVVPATVEALLRRVAYVEHAVLAGSSDNALCAILNVDLARLGKDPSSGELGADERARIAQDATGSLSAVPGYMRPVGLLVVTTPFSIVNGELTTNLKLRRTVIADKFGTQLERLREVARAAGEPRVPAVLVA